MFCDEPIIKVYEMAYGGPLAQDWHDSFLQKAHHLEYHATDGMWLVFETKSKYITLGYDGVKITDEKGAFPGGDCFLDAFDEHSFEDCVFAGERVVGVEPEEEYIKLNFDHFSIRVYGYGEKQWRWFEYNNHCRGCRTVAGCDHLLTQKCACGGRGEVLLDHVDDFLVRCRDCHASTVADMSPARAIKHWNKMERPARFDTDDEALAEQLKKENIRYIALSDQRQWFLDEQVCEADSAILAFEDCYYCLACQRVDEERETFLVSKLSNYNRALYTNEIHPSVDGTIAFVGFTDPEEDQVCGLSLTLDDTRLLISTNDDLSLSVGIGSVDDFDFENTKRKTLLAE